MTEPDPRTVDLEVVPGTPDQVWDAIATGPGISSWYPPASTKRRRGLRLRHGRVRRGRPAEPQGSVTAYDAPHRFATEAPWSTGGQSTTLATEWLVAARGARAPAWCGW